MTRHRGAIRGWAITALVFGVLTAATSLFLPNGHASLQAMPASIKTGEPPPAMVTTCASPLSTGSAYAKTAAGTAVLDCPALVSRRRWTAGAAGLLALVGMGVLIGLGRSDRRDDRATVGDAPTATTPS